MSSPIKWILILSLVFVICEARRLPNKNFKSCVNNSDCARGFSCIHGRKLKRPICARRKTSGRSKPTRPQPGVGARHANAAEHGNDYMDEPSKAAKAKKDVIPHSVAHDVGNDDGIAGNYQDEEVSNEENEIFHNDEEAEEDGDMEGHDDPDALIEIDDDEDGADDLSGEGHIEGIEDDDAEDLDDMDDMDDMDDTDDMDGMDDMDEHTDDMEEMEEQGDDIEDEDGFNEGVDDLEDNAEINDLDEEGDDNDVEEEGAEKDDLAEEEEHLTPEEDEDEGFSENDTYEEGQGDPGSDNDEVPHEELIQGQEASIDDIGIADGPGAGGPGGPGGAGAGPGFHNDPVIEVSPQDGPPAEPHQDEYPQEEGAYPEQSDTSINPNDNDIQTSTFGEEDASHTTESDHDSFVEEEPSHTTESDHDFETTTFAKSDDVGRREEKHFGLGQVLDEALKKVQMKHDISMQAYNMLKEIVMSTSHNHAHGKGGDNPGWSESEPSMSPGDGGGSHMSPDWSEGETSMSPGDGGSSHMSPDWSEEEPSISDDAGFTGEKSKFKGHDEE